MKIKLMITALFSLLLSACSGGGGGDQPTPSPSPSPSPSPTTELIQGLVAEGAPLINTAVYLKDASGQTKSSTTDTQGKFSIDVSDISFPVIIKAGDYFSIAYEASYVNVTPFTTLIASDLVGETIADFYNVFPNGGSVAQLKSFSDLRLAETSVKQKVLSVINLIGIDLIQQKFSPQQGDSYDDLLEELKTYLTQNSLSFDDFQESKIINPQEGPLTCSSNEHEELGNCVSNTKSCSISYGTGQTTWNGTTWGTCQAQSCELGYEIVQFNCVASSGSTTPSNEEEYQTVSIIETQFNQMATNQLEKMIDDSTLLVRSNNQGLSTGASHYVIEGKTPSALKIKLPGQEGYFSPSADMMTKYNNKIVFYHDNKLYVANGLDSEAVVVDNTIRTNPSYQMMRSGDKIYMILEDYTGGQLINFLFEVDLTQAQMSLSKITGIDSTLLNPSPKFIGVDGQGNVLIEKSVVGAFDYYSFNPTTKSMNLIQSNSTTSFRKAGPLYFDNFEINNFISLDGHLVRFVEIKNGSNWVLNILSIGNGVQSLTPVSPVVNFPVHVRIIDNKYLAYSTSYYDGTSTQRRGVSLYSHEGGATIPFSEIASEFTITSSSPLEYISKTNSILGIVGAKENLYALVSTSSVTMANGVETSSENIRVIKVKLSDRQPSDVVSLPLETFNALKAPSVGYRMNFYNMAYLKGGIVMVARNENNTNDLVRLRLDTGTIEIIKNDFFFSVNDNKSINSIYKYYKEDQILISGEDASTNGNYGKMFILE